MSRSKTSNTTKKQDQEREKLAKELEEQKKNWFAKSTIDAKFFIKQPNDKDGKKVKDRVVISDDCSIFIFDSSFEIRKIIV